MSETFTFKLAGTSKKDFSGNSRQDNLVGLEVGDGVSLEKRYEEEGYEEVVLVISDLGDELGEVPSSYSSEMVDLLSRNFEGTGFVKSIAELSSGKLSVTVEISLIRERGIKPGKPFFTKIKGVTFNNADGRHRQDIIKNTLKVGDTLIYQRISDNEEHPNSIAILTSSGENLGFFPANCQPN